MGGIRVVLRLPAALSVCRVHGFTQDGLCPVVWGDRRLLSPRFSTRWLSGQRPSRRTLNTQNTQPAVSGALTRHAFRINNTPPDHLA